MAQRGHRCLSASGASACKYCMASRRRIARLLVSPICSSMSEIFACSSLALFSNAGASPCSRTNASFSCLALISVRLADWYFPLRLVSFCCSLARVSCFTTSGDRAQRSLIWVFIRSRNLSTSSKRCGIDTLGSVMPNSRASESTAFPISLARRNASSSVISCSCKPSATALAFFSPTNSS